MAYDPNNAPACLMDGFASAMPRLFLYSSTNTSTDISLYVSSLGSSANTGVGFFKGAGEFSRGLNAIGMRVNDILIHLSKANQSSTDFPGVSFPGIVTIHSVIASTPNTSTNMTSVAYDATLQQPSL